MVKTKRKKLIDEKERKVEENIITTYMSVVDNFIKNRKKKITL